MLTNDTHRAPALRYGLVSNNIWYRPELRAQHIGNQINIMSTKPVNTLSYFLRMAAVLLCFLPPDLFKHMAPPKVPPPTVHIAIFSIVSLSTFPVGRKMVARTITPRTIKPVSTPAVSTPSLFDLAATAPPTEVPINTDAITHSLISCDGMISFDNSREHM